MDTFEAIHTMSRKARLGLDRVAVLAGVEEWRLRENSGRESNLLLDEFVRIVDVCGYRLVVIFRGDTFAIKPNAKACVRVTDVTPAYAIEQVLNTTDESLRSICSNADIAESYIRGAMRKLSVPRLFVFIRFVKAAGCELRIRKFGETYPLGLRLQADEDAGRPDYAATVLLSSGAKRDDDTARNGIGQSKRVRTDASDSSVGIETHNAFKAYYERLAEQRREVP